MHDVLKKIKKQSKLWLIFGWMTPFLFLLASTALYGITHASIPSIIYASWIFFVAISIFWWMWIIKVVSEMASMFNTILHLIKNLNQEISSVHDDLKKL